MKPSHWAQIPVQLRQLPHWCYTCPDDAVPGRRKAPRRIGNHLASVTDPSQWMTFEQACMCAAQAKGEVGFVLTAQDGFTCIDLDVKDITTHPGQPEVWTKQEDFDRYWKICQYLDSYTEVSRSGKGLHIWLYGHIGAGARRDGVEVYSQERFIICTGNVVLDKPLRDGQKILDSMMSDMRSGKEEKVALVESEQTLTDAELVERAMSAGNAEKFHALCCATASVVTGGHKMHGSYIDLGYPSQSEADLALLSIFAFYSDSNEQCRRLFRYSGLGKRGKALDSDRYLNDTLRVIRGRQAAERAADAQAVSLAADSMMHAAWEKEQRGKVLLHVPASGVEPVQTPAPASAAMASLSPKVVEEEGGLSWPPGLAGEIAKYIYATAPRPVKEVAIISALGFLAGVCGKAFSIPQSGLNLYMVLIARSAVGKEAMHSGIASLITAANNRQPGLDRFVDFSDFASGPALKKAVAANTSFVNVAGEWGHKLRRLAIEDGRDTPMSQLRHVMTDLYQKSGPSSIVGGIRYSNKDSNIESVSGVAYSMIGESTPGRFYESLTESMMEDGFMSRFLLIEYNGKRPPLNTKPLREPSKALGDAVTELCTQAATLVDRNENTAVARTTEASEVIEAFEVECDSHINSTDDEMWRQMWNRASLKMMRVSALLAVAENWVNPVITTEHTTWALELIRNDIKFISDRIVAGDVGLGDDAKERKLVDMLRKYHDTLEFEKYGISKDMWQDGVVPRRHIQAMLGRSKVFTASRNGASYALEQTIRWSCDNGHLMEMDKFKTVDKYGFHGKCYKILNLPPSKRR